MSGMTHVHAPVIRSNAEISDQVRNIKVGRLTARSLVTAVAALFVAGGWLIGRTSFCLLFSVVWFFNRVQWLGACARMGWDKGMKHTMVPK